MKSIGGWILAVGVIWVVVALNLDTSVEVSPGVKVANFDLLAQQQNQVILGALISFAGLLCVIFRKNSGVDNEKGCVKCPLCAEYIKPDAIKCKHCHSELPRGFATVEMEQLLAEFNAFSHHDFVSDDGYLREINIQKFSDIGSRYLDVVSHTSGDLTQAEKDLLGKIESITTMLDSEMADEFNNLCVKHSPWLVMG